MHTVTQHGMTARRPSMSLAAKPTAHVKQDHDPVLTRQAVAAIEDLWDRLHDQEAVCHELPRRWWYAAATIIRLRVIGSRCDDCRFPPGFPNCSPHCRRGGRGRKKNFTQFDTAIDSERIGRKIAWFLSLLKR